MRFAARPNGTYTAAATATRGDDLVCPVCGETLIVRRGMVRAPHFAHRPGSSCGWVASRAAAVRSTVDDGQLTLFADFDDRTPSAGRSHRVRLRGMLRAWWGRRLNR